MVRYLQPNKKGEMAISSILRKFHQLDVGTVMKAKMWDMAVVTPDTSMEEVFTILSSRKHIWVVDDLKTMKLEGLITERDLVDLIAPRKVEPYQFSIGGHTFRSILFGGVEAAEDMMVSDLVTVSPKQNMGQALLKMKRHHLKRLPVVLNGKLVGELTMKAIVIQFKKVLRWTSIMEEHAKTEVEEPSVEGKKPFRKLKVKKRKRS